MITDLIAENALSYALDDMMSISLKDVKSISEMTLTGALAAAAGLINPELAAIALQPRLAGVPIKVSQVSCRMSSDVPETPVIVQSAAVIEYKMDTTVPHPKEWNLTGVITPILPIVDDLFYIKPSIELQILALERAWKSGKPVRYTDETKQVYKVFIKELQITSTSDVMNGKHIACTLKEANILTTPLFDIPDIDIPAAPILSAVSAAAGAVSKTKFKSQKLSKGYRIPNADTITSKPFIKPVVGKLSQSTQVKMAITAAFTEPVLTKVIGNTLSPTGMTTFSNWSLEVYNE